MIDYASEFARASVRERVVVVKEPGGLQGRSDPVASNLEESKPQSSASRSTMNFDEAIARHAIGLLAPTSLPKVCTDALMDGSPLLQARELRFTVPPGPAL